MPSGSGQGKSRLGARPPTPPETEPRDPVPNAGRRPRIQSVPRSEDLAKPHSSWAEHQVFVFNGLPNRLARPTSDKRRGQDASGAIQMLATQAFGESPHKIKLVTRP